MSPRAFDPRTRTWAPQDSPGAVPLPVLSGELICDGDSVRWAAEDFGHVVTHRPRAVLRPGEVGDVAAIVAFAGRAGLTVAARGAGHSPYGQAQAPGGIVIDMTCLDHVGEVRAGRITAQAGARWSELLDVALGYGYTPPVLTDYLHTTVGGTLTVGGIGGTTHRHGMQVDAVVELTVVTGSGQLMTCSRERNRRLFDAVRAGLGQCGIITSATVRLIPAPTRVRWHRLFYRDLAGYLTDQRQLVLAGRFDYLEGQIVPAEPRGWHYVLEVATFDPPAAVPGLPGGLSHEQHDVEEVSYREFQHRMAPGEAALRASGEWWYPHAWLNVFLPQDTTAQVVRDALAGLTAADLGNSGLMILYPVRTDRLRTPLARVPESELVWLFALLRTASADHPAAVPALIEANRAIYDHATARGGLAYPVNTLPMSSADWRAHFGPSWPQLLATKAEYDPHAILTPGHGITGR